MPNIFGNSKITMNGKMGVIEFVTGKIQLLPSYDDVTILYQEYHGLYLVSDINKYGILTNNDVVKIPIKYDDVLIISNFINLLENNNWLIFDKNLNKISLENLTQVIKFVNYRILEHCNIFAIADSGSNIIFPLFIKTYKIIEGKFIIIENCFHRFGVLGTELSWIIEPNYYRIEITENKTFKLKDKEGFGLSDLQGNVILGCHYQDCHQIGNCYIVREDNNWKLIKSGVELFANSKKAVVMDFYNNLSDTEAKNKNKLFDNRKFHSDIEFIPENKVAKEITDFDIKKIYESIYIDNDNIIYIPIRLSKVSKDLNISINQLNKYFNIVGLESDRNPNSRVSKIEYVFLKKIKDTLLS
jgi:hypothetical protein